MQYILIIIKLLGFFETIEQFVVAEQAKKKQQGIADVPTTKQERTDAANKGDL